MSYSVNEHHDTTITTADSSKLDADPTMKNNDRNMEQADSNNNDINYQTETTTKFSRLLLLIPHIIMTVYIG